MGSFKDLRVWNDAIELAVSIYEVTRDGHFSKDFGLKQQIQRATVSISSNIAEGHERASEKATINHFKIAIGSAAEVISQLHIACKINYINTQEFQILENKTEKIKASLINLIKARRETKDG